MSAGLGRPENPLPPVRAAVRFSIPSVTKVYDVPPCLTTVEQTVGDDEAGGVVRWLVTPRPDGQVSHAASEDSAPMPLKWSVSKCGRCAAGEHLLVQTPAVEPQRRSR
jgi:hypothetical protein